MAVEAIEAMEAEDVDGVNADGLPFVDGAFAAIEPKDCKLRASDLIGETSAGDEDNWADWSFTEPKFIAPPDDIFAPQGTLTPSFMGTAPPRADGLRECVDEDGTDPLFGAGD